MLTTATPTAALFHPQGEDYVLVIDSDSDSPEVEQLTTTSAQCVTTHMKSFFFSRYGVPQWLGTMVLRTAERNSKKHGFQDTTSSPLCPQAHGQAEKWVQIFKRLLKKASDGKSDPCDLAH